MWQAFLISLIQFWVSMVEAFVSSKTWSSSVPQSEREEDHTTAAATKDEKLQWAYTILELTPPVTNMDQVRSQWKKLSRRYHPDRNQGSEESHKKQQDINEAMDRIQQALEGGNGRNDDHDDDDTEHHHQQADEDTQPPPRDYSYHYQSPPPPSQPNRHRAKDENQKARKKRKAERQKKRWQQEQEMKEYQRMHALRQEALKKQREELLARLQEELRKEQEQSIRISQEIDKIKRETSQLEDLEQRQASSRLFLNHVDRYRRRRGNQQQGRTNHADDHETNDFLLEKPKHYIMESCTNKLVVAMRLGMEDAAVHMLDDEINDFLHDVRTRPVHYSRLLIRLANAHGEVSTEQLVAEAINVVILKSLDEDDNTLMHYAVYWECAFMIRCLCDVANRSGLLEEVFYAKDLHGTVPMDLAWISKNPDIMGVLQTYESLLRDHRERSHLGLALIKAMKQLSESVRTKFDLVTVGNTILVYYVGRYGAGLHWVFACLGICALQCPHVIARALLDEQIDVTAPQDARLAPFLSFLAGTKIASIAIRVSYVLLVRVFPWELFLLLIPVIILCGGCSCNTLRLMELALVICTSAVAMLIYHPLVVVEKFIFRHAWSRLPNPIRRRYGLLQFVILIAILLMMTGTGMAMSKSSDSKIEETNVES
jgi:hypothetical protein